MKGFNNPYTVKMRQLGMPLTSVKATELWAIFEAGGEEAVRCLKEEAQRVHDLPVLSEEHIVLTMDKGTWVFIEEG